MRHWIGLVVHALIHGLVTALLIVDPLAHWLPLTALALLHLATDWLKPQLRFGRRWLAFLVDQLIHLMILLDIALLSPGLSSALQPTPLYLALAGALIPALSTLTAILLTDMDETASPLRAPCQRISTSMAWAARHAGWLLTSFLLLARVLDPL